jgi:hypothetical protein
VSVAGSRLFDGDRPAHIPLKEVSELHLHVSVRSPRAKHIAEWVNHVVSGHADSARNVATQFGNFPIGLTRDLARAREWLCEHRIDDRRRAGLVASSGAIRHRAFGIEVSSGFRRGFSYEDWFLGEPSDVRSSSFLEVAATEFEIQGLEIDLSGVCWANDFWFDLSENKWQYQRFKGTRWSQVKKKDHHDFVVNKYRVLLTRAREGMIIWVPRGSETDETLPASQFDGTAEYLRQCGLVSV